MCTGGVSQPANAAPALDAMRASMQNLAQMYTTHPSDSALQQVRTQLDQLIRDQAPNGSAFVQVSEMAPWGGSLRWTIRADLSSSVACAEAPTHRTGTTTIGDQHGTTSGTTAGTTGSHTTTVGAGDSSVASTSGSSHESTTGGSHSGSTSTATTGAIDMFEQQLDYNVDWTVTAGIDPDSINPMNLVGGMFSALSGMPSSYSENGSTAIGTVSVMNVDATPPHAGGGGGSPRTGGGGSGGTRGPQEIMPGQTSPHGPERVPSSAERHARGGHGARH